MLEQMSYGGAIIESNGQGVRLNSTAKRLIVEQTGIPEREMEDPARSIEALQRLLPPGTSQFSLTADSWRILPREGRRQLAVRTIRLENSVPPDPEAVVILVDLDGVPQINPKTLEEIFDMTAAEARVAVQLAASQTVAGIATAENISIAATRSLLAAVFTKTNTRRQRDLVSLLERIALLP
jgi:DNA-binding CsgD family transcriptional regulator